MGFMDELKKLTRPYSDDDDDFEDDIDLEEEAPKQRASRERFSRERDRAPRERDTARPARERSSYFDEVLDGLGHDREQRAPISSASPLRAESNVVEIGSALGNGRKMVVVKPDRFEQVEEIGKKLQEGCTVIVNLEVASKDIARRIVDFLSGCAYALNGGIEKAATLTYVVTPRGVD
ncbi:MAG: cell division protein SepF, partial [Oscillospiraceae bacterium]|nr:cell division protein SepF [Oscillospiraceae bacterium]